MAHIAGRLALPDVMARLATRRPVFHSEADFQFAFAQAIADLDRGIRIRLEVPQRAERRTYLDMQCAADQVSLIEFKYVTRTWTGHDGVTDEVFSLRSHEALDLARLYFVHDVTRLEDWVTARPDTNGFAVLLSNDKRLWEPPTSARVTRDRNFRLHEGQTLTADLTWGPDEQPYDRNYRHLRGSYIASWRAYSHLDEQPGGTLRWLGFQVTN
ncbi:hypothetical protein [Isoptericola sp. NPDC055881]